jgi:hypothetical protein
MYYFTRIAKKDQYQPESGLLRIDITQDSLSVSMNGGTPFAITLSEWRQIQEWRDSCVWSVVFTEYGEPLFLVNTTAESLSARRQQNMNWWMLGRRVGIRLIVPHKGADFNAIAALVFLKTGESLESNKTFTEIPQSEMESVIYQFLPTLEIVGSDTIASGGMEEYTVNVTLNGQSFEQPIDVYLETVNGYLPKTVLRVLGGQHTFKVHAFGLDPGDNLKVKAGFRYYVGKANKMIGVV